MIIYIRKFGTTLISRPTGKEAWLAYQSSLKDLGPSEPLQIDFEGVITLSPSWADEFLTPLTKKYGDKLRLLNISNASVIETLKILDLLPQ